MSACTMTKNDVLTINMKTSAAAKAARMDLNVCLILSLPPSPKAKALSVTEFMTMPTTQKSPEAKTPTMKAKTSSSS